MSNSTTGTSKEHDTTMNENKTLARVAFEALYDDLPSAWNNLAASGVNNWERTAAAVEAEVLKRQAGKSAYLATSELPPSLQSGLSVLAYHKPSLKWMEIGYTHVACNPQAYTHWMPQPPAPISADDAARIQAIADARAVYTKSMDSEAAYVSLWNAALAHRDNKP